MGFIPFRFLSTEHKVFALCGLLILVGLMIFFILDHLKYHTLAVRGLETQGTVSRVQTHLTNEDQDSGDQSYSYTITVVFRDQFNQRSADIDHPAPLTPGTSVHIVYDPNDPQVIELKEELNRRWLKFSLGLFFILLFGFLPWWVVSRAHEDIPSSPLKRQVVEKSPMSLELMKSIIIRELKVDETIMSEKDLEILRGHVMRKENAEAVRLVRDLYGGTLSESKRVADLLELNL